MALYYDAVTVLTGEDDQGSLKSRIYGRKASLTSKPSQVYALITECAKYDTFLKEVIDNAGILKHEPKLSPLLSILLIHDHFLSKSGIAASKSHVLRAAIERHKGRLQSQFTKARLRRKCGNDTALKQKLQSEYDAKMGSKQRPRWVRANTLKTTAALPDEFKDYTSTTTISELIQAGPGAKLVWLDSNIPRLLAFSPYANLVKTEAYVSGDIILQDKASCFPAELLLRGQTGGGDVIDACAAPGNKTTHLTAIIHESESTTTKPQRRIFACERDPERSKLLQSMVSKAGASEVEVLAKQDFLGLDPRDSRFAKVTHLLLDPSCSGSGIVGREDMPVLALPNAPSRVAESANKKNQNRAKGKKRKRDEANTQIPMDSTQPDKDVQKSSQQPPENPRLQKLSNLQSHIIEHAFAFPAAIRITYSTCSIHTVENEAVVARVLQSPIARARGWKLLVQNYQPQGISDWPHRGKWESIGKHAESPLTKDDLEACVRCYPDDEHGTIGFFVCCFIRDPTNGETNMEGQEKSDGHKASSLNGVRAYGAEGEDWSGFDD